MTKAELAEQMRCQHRDYYRSGEYRRMIESIGLKYSAVDEHMANMYDDLPDDDVIVAHLVCANCHEPAADEKEIARGVAESRDADGFLARYMSADNTCFCCAADWPNEL
jgi:lysyl-tRNA synthetase class I